MQISNIYSRRHGDLVGQCEQKQKIFFPLQLLDLLTTLPSGGSQTWLHFISSSTLRLTQPSGSGEGVRGQRSEIGLLLCFIVVTSSSSDVPRLHAATSASGPNLLYLLLHPSITCSSSSSSSTLPPPPPLTLMSLLQPLLLRCCSSGGVNDLKVLHIRPSLLLLW